MEWGHIRMGSMGPHLPASPRSLHKFRLEAHDPKLVTRQELAHGSVVLPTCLVSPPSAVVGQQHSRSARAGRQLVDRRRQVTKSEDCGLLRLSQFHDA